MNLELLRISVSQHSQGATLSCPCYVLGIENRAVRQIGIGMWRIIERHMRYAPLILVEDL